MNPQEFLYQLKNLPEDTLLTSEHIKGIVEVLQPLIEQEKKVEKTNYDEFADSKLINEIMLADWICESVHTIQKWRVKGTGPKFVKSTSGSVRYKVGHIKEWIDGNVYGSTTEYDYRKGKRKP